MPEATVGFTFIMASIAAVATASFGALGWIAHRIGKDIDTLWEAVDEMRGRADKLKEENTKTRIEAADAAREYVTKLDIEKMEARLERRLGDHETRVLAAIHAAGRGGHVDA